MFAIKQRFVVNGKVARVTVSGCRGASYEDIEFFVVDVLHSDRNAKFDVTAARVVKRCGDVALVEYFGSAAEEDLCPRCQLFTKHNGVCSMCGNGTQPAAL